MQMIDKTVGISAHKIKMRERREAQRARTAGFTPIKNQRVLDFLQSQKMLVAMAHMNGGSCSLKPEEIEKRAFDNLRKSLPALPHQKRHRQVKPSRSDHPEYRKAARRID